MTPDYQARLARARELQAAYPFAADVLGTYAAVCGAQEELALGLADALGPCKPCGPELREHLDPALLLPRAGAALARVARACPAPLRSFLETFRQDPGRMRAALETYVREGGRGGAAQEPREALAARILVAPYAELLSAAGQETPPGPQENRCPRCAALPVAGVLRPEGDGGKRSLVCAFCGAEWGFSRICCAYCGEREERALPVFVAEELPHVRVEACDTCRRCLRTVDLTRNGRAVPLVDDLAAIPLALWAEESGYRRIQENLFGT